MQCYKCKRYIKSCVKFNSILKYKNKSNIENKLIYIKTCWFLTSQCLPNLVEGTWELLQCQSIVTALYSKEKKRIRNDFHKKKNSTKKKVYYMFNPRNLDLSFMFTLVPNRKLLGITRHCKGICTNNEYRHNHSDNMVKNFIILKVLDEPTTTVS